MAPSDDLSQHATSSHDFYGLLGVTFTQSESDIKRAYRKAVLKYHPDKATTSDLRANVEKFHLVQTAYEVLTDPVVKAAYDAARGARLAKDRAREERTAGLEGRRRAMAEELERRERGGSGGLKRERDELDEEEKLEREIRRLGEDGKRRRRERDDQIRRDQQRREEEEMRVEAEGLDDPFVDGPGQQATMKVHVDEGPEIERTVRIRWPRENELISGLGLLDRSRLNFLFRRFGTVETVIPIKEKRLRVGRGKEKKLMASACVVYQSLLSAKMAVTESSSQDGPEWDLFESVVILADQGGSASTADKGAPLKDSYSATSTPSATPNVSRESHSKDMQTPAHGSPFRPLSTPGSTASPTFEETMKRLKNAEKARLESEARKQEIREPMKNVASEAVVEPL